MSVIRNRLQEIKRLIETRKTRIQTVAANAAIVPYLNRIFVEGKATDGTDIGQYSTDELSVHIPSVSAQLPKSRLKARSRLSGGKVGKTAYYKEGEGYRAFRPDVGRQNKKVDLNLTGSAQGTIQVGISGDDVVIGFTDEESRDILKWNEEKFKGKDKVLPLSKEEREAAAKAAQKEIVLILSNE